MEEERGGVGFGFGIDWIWWIIIIVVIIFLFCPGIFGGFGHSFRE
jgi:Sec-independent protein translocase protein TatA